MEYIFTNLPQYIKTHDRSVFESSVVKENHVLLFSEDGETLTAKLPDGSFQAIGGGGETSFYQCASVDTDAGTWTGYKWNLNEEGVYELEEELTTDELTITGFEPVVGGSYSADTLIMAGKMYTGPDPMPTDGLVFHVSLASNAPLADTGQALTESSDTGATSIVYQTFQGIPCAYFSGENRLLFPDTGLPEGRDPFSFSLWFCADYVLNANKRSVPVVYGEFSTYNATSISGFALDFNANGGHTERVDEYGGGIELFPNPTFEKGQWYHVAITFDGSNLKGYCNGVLVQEKTPRSDWSTVLGQGVIGSPTHTTGLGYIGYLAGIRVYNRALTMNEVKILNNEFRTPYIDIADTLSISFKLNEEISYSLNATDSLGNACTYEIVSGTLPTGVDFDVSTGIFSGTPTVEETVNVVIKCYTKKAEKEVPITIKVASSSLSVPGQLWGFKNGEFWFDNTITATATGYITADAGGNFTLGNDKYFDLDSTVLTGASPRTFIMHATLTSNNAVQFIDGGYQDTSRVFAIGYGYSGDSIFYHFWGNDNDSWLNLSPSSYIIAFTYDGSVLTCYVNGEVLGTYETALDTGTETKYRIGQYVLDDWWSSGEWKSKFYAIYDRALTQDEIAQLTDEINNA